jgi:hypothetical protein
METPSNILNYNTNSNYNYNNSNNNNNILFDCNNNYNNNSNILEWSNTDVINWLTTLNNNSISINYKQAFIDHGLNGEDLIDLTEDNLKYDLKVIKLHDRKYIMRSIRDLMKNFIKCFEKETKLDNNNNIKHILIKNAKIKEDIRFKCTNNDKIKNIINDCKEIFHIESDINVFLVDAEGSIIPKEASINDIITDNECLYLIISSYEPKTKKEKKESINNVNSINNNINSNTYNNKQNNNNTNTLIFSNNNTIQENSITETALKKRYLSFETLDDFEKNGFSFSVNNNLSKKFEKASNRDKFTINSFYNISNLNNFNERSPFSSYDNKNSNLLISPKSKENDKSKEKDNQKTNKKKKLSCIRSKKKIDLDNFSENEIPDNVSKMKFNMERLYTLNNSNDNETKYNYHSNIFKERENSNSISYNNDSSKGFRSKKNSQSQYFDRLSNRNSDINYNNASVDSTNLYYRKNNFFDKLYNYYNEAKKIKGKII